jgi:hypothetical protein
MDYKEVRNQIFNINSDIRFVGIIGRTGKLIEGGMRDGLEALDDEMHRKRWINQIAMRAEMYEMFTKFYGKTDMVYVIREKLKQLTFYRTDKIVYVTLQPHVDSHEVIEIANSISKILDSNEIT